MPVCMNAYISETIKPMTTKRADIMSYYCTQIKFNLEFGHDPLRPKNRFKLDCMQYMLERSAWVCLIIFTIMNIISEWRYDQLLSIEII